MFFYFKCANNNHIGIFDVLLMETMLVKTENSGVAVPNSAGLPVLVLTSPSVPPSLSMMLLRGFSKYSLGCPLQILLANFVVSKAM